MTRFIKLKIDQKIEEFQARANSSAAGGLATTNRAAVTTVVVKDRDTIAMGGLMRDQSIESVSKVPFLGDIPIVGWLFKNTTKTVSKVNLTLLPNTTNYGLLPKNSWRESANKPKATRLTFKV